MDPIPIRLPCPKCGELHVDAGDFATKIHHTHSCQHCGHTWRPAVVPTVGVRFLPGFKNEGEPDWSGTLPCGLIARCFCCGAETNAPATYGYTFIDGQWRCDKHSRDYIRDYIREST